MVPRKEVNRGQEACKSNSTPTPPCAAVLPPPTHLRKRNPEAQKLQTMSPYAVKPRPSS